MMMDEAPQDPQKPLAALLLRRRAELEITLDEMVRRLKGRHLKVSDSALSRWENGQATPLEVYLPHIATAYRIPRGIVRKAWLAQKAA